MSIISSHAILLKKLSCLHKKYNWNVFALKSSQEAFITHRKKSRRAARRAQIEIISPFIMCPQEDFANISPPQSCERGDELTTPFALDTSQLNDLSLTNFQSSLVHNSADDDNETDKVGILSTIESEYCGNCASASPPKFTRPRKATKQVGSRNIFKSNRNDITAEVFQFLNEKIFLNELPSTLEVTWNPRLLTTAGLTYCKETSSSHQVHREASIELSTKVVDSRQRLLETLLHELCHAAAWLIDGVRKPPHGAAFLRWAQRAQRICPDIPVSTCHSYAIFKPHVFRCEKEDCAQEISRHSKKGIDLDRLT